MIIITCRPIWNIYNVFLKHFIHEGYFNNSEFASIINYYNNILVYYRTPILRNLFSFWKQRFLATLNYEYFCKGLIAKINQPFVCHKPILSLTKSVYSIDKGLSKWQ